MEVLVPEEALRFGFVNSPVGTHTSRTLMLAELTRVLDGSCPAAGAEEMRRLVVAENLTLKRTEATRRETFRRLRELYALDPRVLLYRALRDLWPAAESERPLLALLCAAARDPHLQATAQA